MEVDPATRWPRAARAWRAGRSVDKKRWSPLARGGRHWTPEKWFRYRAAAADAAPRDQSSWLDRARSLPRRSPARGGLNVFHAFAGMRGRDPDGPMGPGAASGAFGTPHGDPARQGQRQCGAQVTSSTSGARTLYQLPRRFTNHLSGVNDAAIARQPATTRHRSPSPPRPRAERGHRAEHSMPGYGGAPGGVVGSGPASLHKQVGPVDRGRRADVDEGPRRDPGGGWVSGNIPAHRRGRRGTAGS